FVYTVHSRQNLKWQAIWKIYLDAPTPHPMINDPPLWNSAAVPATREKLDLN
ncbi:hypothetical protein Tco_0611158, partial [Tanacetum coccineum]